MTPQERISQQLCSIQGKLFELSGRHGLNSEAFIDAFMSGPCAEALDRPYDRLQWAGEEYVLEEMLDENPELPRANAVWSDEPLFWTGYLYRRWHNRTGEPSARIVRIVRPQVMLACWPGYHTLDPDMAIDRLIEAARLAEGDSAQARS